MRLPHFMLNGKENVVYGARITREGKRGVEYFLGKEYAFGRVWDAETDVLIGYWFNDNPESMQEMRDKLRLTPLTKTIHLDKAYVKKIRAIANGHNDGFISDVEYRTLVDGAIELYGSLY